MGWRVSKVFCLRISAKCEGRVGEFCEWYMRMMLRVV